MLNSINKPFRGRIINRSHPLSDGLIFAPIFNEGAGLQVLDHANFKKGSFNSAPVWSIREQGTGLDFDGTDDRIDFEALNYDISSGAFTIISICDIDVLTHVVHRYILTQHASDNVGLSLLFYQYITLSGVFAGQIYTPTTAMTKLSAESTLVANTIYHLAWSYNGSGVLTHTNHFLFKNGVEVSYGTNITGSGTRYTGLGKISVGGRITDNTRNWDGFIGGTWVWDRYLSQYEIIQHYANPWAMFQQPSRAKYFDVGGVSALSISLSENVNF